MSNAGAQLKHSLSSGKVTIGSWLTLGNEYIAETMAGLGFDWLTVDMEHSAIDLPQAQRLIQTVALTGCAALVRVGENDPCVIKRVMDAGAHGVIVPMVNSKEDALKAVKAVKYPPVGTRGVGLARAQNYGLAFDEYKKKVNTDSVVIVQIEHIDAINHLEEILNVKGVDASIIGPYDLSASLGHPGEFERKEVKDTVARYLKVCARLGKPAGFHVIPPDAREMVKKIKQGFHLVAFSLDALFLGTKCRDEMKAVKTALNRAS